jgi:hypothetical protein
MAAARQKLIKLSMTVVATKTLIAGREVVIAVKVFPFPLVVAMIVRWGRTSRSSRLAAQTLAYWIKLEVLPERQGLGAVMARCGAAQSWRGPTPWSFPVNVD